MGGSGLVFAQRVLPLAAVRGSDQSYPVGRIFCVGRNYEAHAREMGAEPDREAPFYFTKSAFAHAPSGATLPYPPGTENYHHEMELVVALGAPAFRIAEDRALDVVWGYACGLDMTRRDLQAQAKEKARPWDLGKDVEGSAVLGAIAPAAEVGHPTSGLIELSVNGEVRQSADLDQLIWSVPELIAHLSRYYHLDAGDLIYTGTPAGVGPVVAGDTLVGRIAGIGDIALNIGPAE